MFRLSQVQALIALVFLTSIYAVSQTSPPLTELQLNSKVERNITPGEVHTYSVKLKQGQILKLIANQRGVDVVVRTFGPDGTKLMEVDSPNGNQGPENVTLFTEATGVYRFEITPFAAPAGRYDVTVVEIRDATKAEMERHKVEKELLEQFERPWDDAHRLRDTTALERLMADDYLSYSVTNRGLNQDKQSHIDGTKQLRAASQNVVVRHDMDDVTARVYGDAAMVTGRVVITNTVNGREQKFPGRFVHLWLLRGGRWQIAGDMFFPADPLPMARMAVKVDPLIYNSYVGKYELDGATQLTLTRAGDNLQLQMGEFQDTLYPESDSEFFSKSMDAQFIFVRTAQGEVPHLIMIQNGRASKVLKIREKKTQ